MLSNATNDRTLTLVKVECLIPFRLRENNVTRIVRGREIDKTGAVTKNGELVDVEFWLANALANHNPPKVGPASDIGRKALERQQAAA